MWFTTSWDDGHPLDLRLSDLMASHGIAGTFYWPMTNREGLPVLSPAQMRQLDGRVEVGSHTRDHAYASSMSPAAWEVQVTEGKQALEDVVGHAVEGFCYPGGKLAAQSREVVSRAGFRYARTTANLQTGRAADVFTVPTSLQFFPHRRRVLARNFVRHGHWHRRLPLTWQCLVAPDFERRMARVLEAAGSAEMFHLWGHSWEIDRHDLWQALSRFFALVDTTVPRSSRLTNAALLRKQGLLD